MIDPETITRYDLDRCGLEEHVTFWVLVAGKTADVTVVAHNRIMRHMRKNTGLKRAGAFDLLRAYRERSRAFMQTCRDIDIPPHEMVTSDPVGVRQMLKKFGVGCHDMKSRALDELVDSGLDLKTCSLADLTGIHGIGLKTAACFLLHTRRDSTAAGLDTHMLAELRSRGHKDAPKATPQNVKTYEKWSAVVSKLAREAGMTLPEFDLAIFAKRHRKVGRDPQGKLKVKRK